MGILNRRSVKSGVGAPTDVPVWERAPVEVAVLMIEKKSSTLTIYFPLSIRKKVSKVGTVILRDFLPEPGFSPSVINVMELNPKKKTAKGAYSGRG